MEEFDVGVKGVKLKGMRTEGRMVVPTGFEPVLPT